MATTFNIASYVKNATRSLGYVAVETVKDVNPAIAEFADSNTDALKEMYAAVKDFKKTSRQAKQNIADSEYAKIAKETVSNFFSDLKTGNFYNKERESKAESGIMDSMGFDMLDDWDMDLDNMDFGDDESDELTTSSMDAIGQKISQASGKAAIKSADYVVKANRATTKAMMAQNELLFGKLYSGLSGVNTTIASIGKSIIPSATTHFENSSKFYSHTSEELAKQTGYLEQIYTILNGRFNQPEKKHAKGKTQLDSVIGINGIPDLKAYADVVKENFKETTALISSIFSLFNMNGDGGKSMIRAATASPVAGLLKMVASSATNKLFEKDLDRFNKTLGGLFGSTILKINKKSKQGGLLSGLISDLLGIKTSTKKTINTGNYEKGRVDWNGKDEKALREVLPTQLALILSALTGETPKIFNYESGKWTTLATSQKELSKKVHDISRSNTTDIRDKFKEYYLDDNKDKGITKQSKAYHSFDADLAAFFHYLTMNNDKIPFNNEQWASLEKDLAELKLFAELSPTGIMLRSNFKRIKNYYERNANTKRGHLNMQTNGALMQSRNDIGNMYTREENNPGSNYSMLFNSSGLGTKTGNKKNFLTAAEDNRGNNIFFYLQRFYTNLEKIVDNTSGGIGGGGRRRRVKRNTSAVNYEVPNNVNKAIIDAHKKSELAKSERFVDVDDTNASQEIKEEAKEKNRAEQIKDRTEELIKKNPLIKKLGKVGDVISTLLSVPIKSVRAVLDSADQVMYDFIYGRDKSKENPGILAKILDGFDETFAAIKTSAKKLFNDKISPFLAAMGDNVAKLFGFETMSDVFKGVAHSKFVQGVKSNLKGAAKWVGNSVKDTVLDVGDYFSNGSFRDKANSIVEKVKGFGKVEKAAPRSLREKAQDLMGDVKRFRGKQEDHQAAHGGTVTRSGMISVSEGEMIIPSEMNPLYKGRTNKAEQIRTEIANANKYKAQGGTDYWGNYANGSFDLKRKLRAKIKSNSKFTPLDNRTDGEKLRDTDAYKYADEAIRSAVDYTSNTIRSLGDTIGYRLFGDFYTKPDKDGKVERKSDKDVKAATKKTMGDIFGEMKSHAPAMGAGAVIGAGVAGITGLVGGPLIGAAAGAAIGLITNSENVRNNLFGDGTDEKPGLLGKRIGGFIKNKFPKLAKFGITGGIGGALGVIPGGPIAGLLVGAGLSFATESSELRNYFFGEEGVFGEDTDKIIKDIAPKALLGSAALAFTGPFGLVGNMMLGAGIGFFSDTEMFKKAFFGTPDSDGNMQGGLLGIVRKDVIDPVGKFFKKGASKFEEYMKKYIFEPTKNLFKPLNAMIGNMFASAIDFLKGQISEKITVPLMKRLDNLLFKPITRVLGGLAKGALGILKWPGKAYGTAANAIGNKLKKTQIKRGTAGYMSAEDRELYMEDEKFGLKNTDFRSRAYTKAAAGKTTQELKEFKDAMNAKRAQESNDKNDKKQYKQELMDRVLADSEWESTWKSDSRLKKEINKVSENGGDFSGVRKVVEQLSKQGKIDPKKSEKLNSFLDSTEKKYNAVDQRDNSEIQAEYEKQMEKMGLNPKNFDYKNNKDMRMASSDVRHKVEDDAKREAAAKALEEANAEKKEKEEKENQNKNVDSIRTDAQRLVEEASATNGTLIEIRNVLYNQRGIDIPSFDNNDTSSDNDTSSSDNDTSSSNNDNSSDTDTSSSDTGTSSSNNEQDKPVAKPDVKTEVNNQTKDDSNTQTVFTEYGPITNKKDDRGNWEADMRDSATRNAVKAQEEDRKRKYKFFSMFENMGGILGGLKDKIFGNKEDKKEKKKKKKSIFSKIFDMAKNLFGKAGDFLGGLFGEGGTFSSILSSLPGIAGGAIVLWLANKGLKFLADTSDEHTNPQKQEEARGGTVNHNVFTDTKNNVDNFENMVEKRDLSSYKDDDYQRPYMSDNYIKKGIIKQGLIKGLEGNGFIKHIPILGKVLNAPIAAAGKLRNKVIYSKPVAAAGKGIMGVVKKIGAKRAEKKSFNTAYRSFVAAGINNAEQLAGENVGNTALKYTKSFGERAMETSAGKAISKGITKVTESSAGKAVKKGITKVAESGVGKAGSKVVKAVGSVAEKGTKAVGSFVETAAEKGGILAGLISKIKSMVTSCFNKAFKLFGGRGAEAAAAEAAEEIGERCVEAGAERVTASFAKKATIVIQLAFIAAAVENGWEDAKAILGILDKPTLPQKLLAAIINGINEGITGGIIPIDYIFSIVFNLLNKLGIIDGSALEQQREEAKAIVDDYNADNGTTYNVREYIKNVLGEYTTQEKIGNAVKSVGKGIVGGFKKAGSAIASGAKGLVNGAKGLVSAAGKGLSAVAHSKPVQAIVGGAKKVGSVIAGGAKKLVEGAGNLVNKAFDVGKWVVEAAGSLAKLPADMFKAFQNHGTSLKEVMDTKIDISEDNPLSGIVQTIGKFIKLPIIPGLYIASIGVKIKKDVIDPIVKRVKDTFGQVVDIQKQSLGFLLKGDIGGLFGMKVPDDGDDGTNPIGFISGAVNLVSKVIYAVPTTYSWIGHKIVEKVGEIAKRVKDTFGQVVDIQKQSIGFILKGDIGGLFGMKVPDDEGDGDDSNPIGFISSAVNIVSKIIYAVPTTYSWIGHKIVEKINKIKDAIAAAIPVIGEDLNQTNQLANDGDISGMWNTSPLIDDKENPLSFVSKASNIASKVVFTPLAAFHWIGNKISAVFDKAKAGFALVVQTIVTEQDQLKDYAYNGDISGMWEEGGTAETEAEGPLGFIAKASNVVSKLVYSPLAAFHWIGNKINAVFDTVKTGVAAAAKVVVGSFDNAKTFADAGDFSGMWSADDGSPEESNGPLDFLAKATSITSKLVLSPSAAFHYLGNKIKGFFGKTAKALDIGNLITDLWKFTNNKNPWDGFDKTVKSYEPQEGDSGPIAVIDSLITTLVGGIMKMIVKPIRMVRKIGDTIGGLLGKFKDFLTDENEEEATAASPTTTTAATGSGSGVHVSQADSKFGRRKFGKSTIAQNGCGPAAAATVLRAYGKNASLGDAASFAQSRGYVAGSSGVGTKASYFGDILASQGIGSTYTNKQNQIQKYVGTGSPTILLGQDSSNTSKSNSPFGPNPHYVVARGTDRRGNVIVDDPELNGPALYKKSILKNAKLGVLTGGASAIADSDGTQTATSSATSTDGDYIGKYVKKYESGSKGSAMISSGSGDHGGVSFGSYQFPSNFSASDSLPLFWNKYFASQYPGITPGNNAQFKQAWTEAATKDPSGFFQKEHEFVADQYYTPISKYLIANGVGDPTLYNRAAEEAAWSTAVQMGPKLAASKFAKSGINNNSDPNEYIDKLYNTKTADIPSTFSSSSSAVKSSIKDRYAEEKQMLLGLTNQKPIDPNTTNGATAGEGVTSNGSSSNSGSSSSGGDIGSIINRIISKSLGAIFSKLGPVGEFFSKTFGLTNEDPSTGSASAGFGGSALLGNGGAVAGDVANNFPYFMQADPRWGGLPYGGSGTICSAGCGPTSMAMVLRSYGQNVTPKETADWSAKHGYRVNGGTSWDFFNSIGKEAGIKTQQFTNKETAKQFLNTGFPVIGSMKPGDFTTKGHFIVFSGIDGNRVTVNDPAKKERTEKIWDADNALGQAKQFWTFSKDGVGSLYGKSKQNQSVESDPVATGSGLIVHDFTKTSVGGNSGVRYSNQDITRPINRHAINMAKSTLKQVGGDSGLSSLDTMKLLQTALGYMKIIADNTSANANIKTIVEILNSMMKVMGASVANTAAAMASNNQPEDTSTQDALDADTKSIMARLKQLSEAV